MTQGPVVRCTTCRKYFRPPPGYEKTKYCSKLCMEEDELVGTERIASVTYCVHGYDRQFPLACPYCKSFEPATSKSQVKRHSTQTGRIIETRSIEVKPSGPYGTYGPDYEEELDGERLAVQTGVQIVPNFTRHLARSTDPDTSHAAAAAVAASPARQSLCRKILTELRDNGPGASFQIAERLEMRHDRVWKRCSDLRRAKRIRDSGDRVISPDERDVIVWEVT